MDQKRRDYTVAFASGATLSIKAQNYPERGRIFKTKAGADVLHLLFAPENYFSDCADVAVVGTDIESPPDNSVVEHIIELQTIKLFMAAVANPDNDELENHVDQQCFIDRWLKKDMLSGDSLHVTNSFDPTKPIDRVFDALGSNHNRAGFVIAEKQLNAIKEQLWRLNDPYIIESDEAAAELMELLANVFFVSNYLNQEDVKERLLGISDVVHDLMERIEATAGSYYAGLTAARDEYLPFHIQLVTDHARDWVEGAIEKTIDKFKAATREDPCSLDLSARFSNVEQITADLLSALDDTSVAPERP